MKSKKCKVLHVINGMGTGGAEKDIMNWYRNIDKKRYQFDFLVRNSKQNFYKEEILLLGGKFYQAASFPSKWRKNFRETKKLLMENKYDVIHVHGNALIYIFPLIVAKKIGIKKRIFHVHSTKANGKLANTLHNINKLILGRYANELIACSKEAGKFAFGNRPFKVLNNAIDLNKYEERLSDKEIYSLNLNDKLIVGHVGRFLPVKNHKFIIDSYKEILKVNPYAHLVLIGDGPLKSEIEKYVRNNYLQNKVSFLGERHDVEKIIPCMDIIIFPSLYEGVPLVVLEAQASATKVLCSDVVDNDVKITPYVKMAPLKEGPRKWAKYALSFLDEKIDCDIYLEFKKCGYTIETIVALLNKIYEGND